MQDDLEKCDVESIDYGDRPYHGEPHSADEGGFVMGEDELEDDGIYNDEGT